MKTRSVTLEEAERVWGPFDALILAASSRIRATAAQQELGWQPQHADMLTMIGDQRSRDMATPTGQHPPRPRTSGPRQRLPSA